MSYPRALGTPSFPAGAVASPVMAGSIMCCSIIAVELRALLPPRAADFFEREAHVLLSRFVLAPPGRNQQRRDGGELAARRYEGDEPRQPPLGRRDAHEPRQPPLVRRPRARGGGQGVAQQQPQQGHARHVHFPSLPLLRLGDPRGVRAHPVQSKAAFSVFVAEGRRFEWASWHSSFFLSSFLFCVHTHACIDERE
jgi:hypothetical protein